MSKPITRDELEQIKNWCEQQLNNAANSGPYDIVSTVVCGFSLGLPTHSIRSQMMELVGEVERHRDALIVALSFLDAKGKEKPDKGLLRMILREQLGLTDEKSEKPKEEVDYEDTLYRGEL